MKTIQTLITVSVLALTAPSFASSMQVTCSNPEATVLINEDFRDQEVVMIEKDSSNGSSQSISFGRGELQPKNLKMADMNSIESGKCDGDLGWYSVQRFDYRHVQYKKANGTEFSDRIPGTRLSADKKTLEVHLICETHITGMRPCQSK